MSKTVFTSKELPHIWAHRQAPQGRSPANTSFNGSTFYSYGTAIAELVTGKNGQQGVVLNRTSYSVTTSRHQSRCFAAVSHLERLSVDDIKRGSSYLPSTGEQLRDYYLEDFDPKTVVGHTKVQQARNFLAQVDKLDGAISACSFFGVKHARLLTQRAKLDTKEREAVEIINQAEQKRTQARLKREMDHARAIAQQAKLWLNGSDPDRVVLSSKIDKIASVDPELAAQCRERNAKIQEVKLKQWRAGDKSVTLTGITALRRVGDVIESNHGARVPFDHAKRAYEIIKKRLAEGRTYERNGYSLHVGAYVVDSVDLAGTVKIGCHTIPWSEVEDVLGDKTSHA